MVEEPSAFFGCIGSVGQIHFASYIRGLKTYGAFDFVGDELSQEFVVVATRWWQSK